MRPRFVGSIVLYFLKAYVSPFSTSLTGRKSSAITVMTSAVALMSISHTHFALHSDLRSL